MLLKQQRCHSLEYSSIFNLGGPDILTLKNIALEMGLFLNKEPVFEFTDQDPDFLIADIERCQKLHEPKIKLFQSLKI